MNPFLQWLERFSELVSIPAAWGIFATGALIYVISEWRLRFLALLVQYAFVALLFSRVFDTRPEMALMKLIVGWLIAGALLLSAQIRWRATRAPGRLGYWATSLPFRLLILLSATAVGYLGAQRFTLPYVSAELGLACLLLALLAVLFFGTEEQDPAMVGIGVLNLLTALELFYAAQDPGLLVSGLLVVVSLVVGLAASYLTVAEVPT